MHNEIYSVINKLDSVTYNHSIRVMCIAREIEDFFHLEERMISNAALVHDIGKIYISFKILDKKGKLDQVERELIDLHPYIGYKMLKELGVNEEICRIVLYHHGTFPVLLKEIEPYHNTQINDMAMMLHTIDCFEALTSDRPYHRGLLANEALNLMIKESNHHQAVLEYFFNITEGEKLSDTSAIFRGGYSVESKIIEKALDDMCRMNLKVISPFWDSAV